MMRNAPGTPSALQMLVDALRVLPGVGPKSAQRMAYHLMQHDREGAAQLAQALSEAREQHGEPMEVQLVEAAAHQAAELMSAPAAMEVPRAERGRKKTPTDDADLRNGCRAVG